MRFHVSARILTKSGSEVVLLLAVLVSVTLHAQNHTSSLTGATSGVSVNPTYVGNEACAKCHSSIYNSYKQTPMAHASGLSMENVIPADFTHQASGVHYRIYADAGRAWLTFDRDGNDPMHGKRELLYYIGSGRRGLSYLFADDGFVFESPINWYGDRHLWDMTPAYQNVREIPLNLPAHTSCLHCHVSGMRAPLQGTENRYDLPNSRTPA